MEQGESRKRERERERERNEEGEKVRGHLRISHIADKRKNFHIGGRGFGPDSLCDRQQKNLLVPDSQLVLPLFLAFLSSSPSQKKN